MDTEQCVLNYILVKMVSLNFLPCMHDVVVLTMTSGLNIFVVFEANTRCTTRLRKE